MNSLSLIAVVLGMVSVIITLKYVNSYDKLDTNINKLRIGCVRTKSFSELIKIQDTLDISDKELNVLLGGHSKTIIGLFNKSLKASKNKSAKVKKPVKVTVAPAKVKKPVKVTVPPAKVKKPVKATVPPAKVKKETFATESFVNYKYTDHIQRGLKDFKFTGLIHNRSRK
jgi:hypothetical protein